jgi:hypothetical protein
MSPIWHPIGSPAVAQVSPEMRSPPVMWHPDLQQSV